MHVFATRRMLSVLNTQRSCLKPLQPKVCFTCQAVDKAGSLRRCCTIEKNEQ